MREQVLKKTQDFGAFCIQIQWAVTAIPGVQQLLGNLTASLACGHAGLPADDHFVTGGKSELLFKRPIQVKGPIGVDPDRIVKTLQEMLKPEDFVCTQILGDTHTGSFPLFTVASNARAPLRKSGVHSTGSISTTNAAQFSCTSPPLHSSI